MGSISMTSPERTMRAAALGVLMDSSGPTRYTVAKLRTGASAAKLANGQTYIQRRPVWRARLKVRHYQAPMGMSANAAGNYKSRRKSEWQILQVQLASWPQRRQRFRTDIPKSVPPGCHRCS